jgi:putative zinc finger/helix-turn-helix YgiT family protein
MICIKCGESSLESRAAVVPAEIKGEHFQVQMDKALVCPSCSHVMVDGKDMPEYMRLSADAYRRNHRLLTSDEIRGFRNRLGMTQDQFALYLNVGVASVKRWELGKIQAKAMDRLIRVMIDQTTRQTSSTVSIVRSELVGTSASENQSGFLTSASVMGFAARLTAVVTGGRHQNALGNEIVLKFKSFAVLPRKTGTAARGHGYLTANQFTGQNQVCRSL